MRRVSTFSLIRSQHPHCIVLSHIRLSSSLSAFSTFSQLPSSSSPSLHPSRLVHSFLRLGSSFSVQSVPAPHPLTSAAGSPIHQSVHSSLIPSSSSSSLPPVMTSSGNVSNGVSNSNAYDFDLVVIGGGSGGLAAAKEATKVNPKARVVVFDLVQPSLHGTKWGLGGTCVNVGCIPKKLMHHAGTIGSLMHQHAPQFGWQGLENVKHDWSTMSHLIGDYIKSLNFSYRVGLTGANVKFIEGYATFQDSHTLKWEGKNNKSGSITFDKVLIAVGGRPTYLDIPGSELAITSDDLFWLKKSPGKTLVIGAGYIALECASFLHHIGNDVTVMVRGEILRKMDKQAGQMIGELMERDGIRFLNPASPLSFSSNIVFAAPNDGKEVKQGVWEVPSSTPNSRQLIYASGAQETIDLTSNRSSWTFPPGPVTVSYIFNDDPSNTIHREQFDTILLAVGRQANVSGLNLDKAGVQLINGKVLVDQAEQTTVTHIFSIGDCAIGVPSHRPNIDVASISSYAVDRPELTPVAIEAGLHLARRIMGHSKSLMQYQYIPTTVFTSPSEYAFTGLSEEQAERSKEEGGIGKENVKVFWSRFGNIEISPLHPEWIEPRSAAFIGKNLWARKYAEKNKLDWPEVTFDTELNGYVIYKKKEGEKNNRLDVSRNQGVAARVINKYTDEDGSLLYDIQLEDGDEEIKGVRNDELELQMEQEREASAVFIKSNCLAKLICDSSADLRVVGLHFLGPSAGEVVQGFSLAVQMGATKAHFDRLVGIHPTAAEEFAVLEVDKQSGRTPLKKAGCGGGSCG